MSLEELLHCNQGIIVYYNHINTSLNEIQKNIFRGKSLFYEKHFQKKKYVMYNLRTTNLLTQPKINKGLVFILLVFAPVT